MMNTTAHHNWRKIDAGRVRAVSVRFADAAVVSSLCAQSKCKPAGTICANPAQPPPTR